MGKKKADTRQKPLFPDEELAQFSGNLKKDDRKNIEAVVSELYSKPKGLTKFELADALEVAPIAIDRALNAVRLEGIYNLATDYDPMTFDMRFYLSTDTGPSKEFHLGKEHFPNGDIRLGVISNTRIGNKYHRDDALLAYYRILEREGIKVVLHCGDIIEGEASRKTKNELLLEGPKFQADHLAINYPRVGGITTFFITAPDCEGTFVKKHKRMIGPYLQQIAEEHGRRDLRYIGPNEADVHIDVEGNDAIVRMAHLTTGIPYAISYPAQKMAESIQGGTKPHVILMGHTGQMSTLPQIRDMGVIQVGSFIDQTPSMRNARRSTTVGGIILDLRMPREGEERFKEHQYALSVEMIHFFNRGFYEQNPAYKIAQSKRGKR